MLNACYKIFHVDGLSSERDFCHQQMTSVLSKSYTELDTPTVYLKTVEDVANFYEDNPNFWFNYKEPMVEGGPPFPPNAGTVGVFASNYLAYKNFLDSSYDYLFIFEDDVVISPNFAILNEEYMKELPEGWDIFNTFVPPDCIQWYNHDYDIPEATYICRNYQDWSCAGYVISRNGAAKAIEDVEKYGINDPIDWYVYNAGFHGKRTVYFDAYSPKPTTYHTVRFLDGASGISTIGGEAGTESY